MAENYFAIERNGGYWDHVILSDRDGNSTYEEFLNLSYEEMKNHDALEYFVISSMEASDQLCDVDDDATIVTLVGGDDVFIWSILMGYEDDNIRYCLIDWMKDGKKYRYEE